MQLRKIVSTLLAGLLFVSAGSNVHAETLINGAGATFPYPVYSKWFDEFGKENPELKFNYQSIGSGGGIRQIQSGTVDFGATDGPMTDSQMEAAPGYLYHIPTVLGAVVVTYNIPEIKESIKLSQKVLADIFLGKVTNWSDPALKQLNPGLNLPSKSIIVVRRSDGSGTTYIFVDFLSKVSSAWATKVGRGTSVAWPVGLGGKGNEGVSGLVKQTPYSIGYVEMIYAKQNKLQYALIQNKSGNFIQASIESISLAAKTKMPADFRVSITNSENAQAYPISGFTWLLVYDKIKDPVKGKAIVKFLNWMLEDGQKLAPELGYAPLPKEVKDMVAKTVAKIKVGK